MVLGEVSIFEIMKEYKKWQGKSVVEPKLDGIHAKVTKDGVQTKTGKPIKTVPHIAKAMKRHFKKNPGSKVEGELHRRGNSFEKNLGKFRGGDGKKLKLYVHGDEKPSRLTRHVRRVKGKVVKDEVALNKAHEKNLRRSYEGSVVKRGGVARKLKPKYDEELPVVGSRVRKDGRAGVVSVKGRDGKVFKVQGSASESARAKVGNKATVMYEKTKGGSVRGAKLKSVRNRDFEARDFEADSRLARVGVDGYNKPKRTPGHAKKSHVVVVKEGGKVKVVRFGEQGAKVNQTVAQRKAFKSRHAKNISRGKMSAAYWADKVKWSPSNTVNKKSVEKHDFAGRIKAVDMKRLVKVAARKSSRKMKKAAAVVPMEVRKGAAMGALIPIPGALPAGAAVGGLAIGKEAVERAVRKKTGRPYRLFEAKEGSPLEAGIYRGSRGVRRLPIFKHEYVVVVPEDGRKVKRKLRKKLVDAGGGRKALVMGAYNKRGKLRADYKDKVDVEAFKKSVKSGKGLTRVGQSMDTDRTLGKMVNAAGKYKAGKYPSTLKNITGRGKNSNSYARSLLKKGGVRKIEKAGALTPGADRMVNFDSKCKVMNLQPKDVKKLKADNVVKVKRDGLSKTKDVVSIGGTAAVGVGSVMGGKAAMDAAKDFKKTSAAARAAAKNVSRITPTSVATEVGKQAKGKVKEAFPVMSRIGRALVKKRKLKLFEAHEFGKRGQLRDEKTNQYADSMAAFRGKQKVYKRDHLGRKVSIKDVSWSDPQVLKTAINKGKKVARNTGRAGRFARDIKDVAAGKERRRDAAGRKKKREWEKSYVKNAASAGAGGAAVLGYNVALKKNPRLKTKNKTVNKGLKKVLGGYYGQNAATVDRSVRTRAYWAKKGLLNKVGRTASRYLNDAGEATELGSATTMRIMRVAKAKEKLMKKKMRDIKDVPFMKRETLARSIKAKDKPFRDKLRYKKAESDQATWNYINYNDSGRVAKRGFGSRAELMELNAARLAGWDVRDPRGRSARVFAPGSKRRNRREKSWHEKKENQSKLWKAGVAAALLAGGVAGYRIAGRNSSVNRAVKNGVRKNKTLPKTVTTGAGRGPIAGSGKRNVKPRKRPDLRPDWKKRRDGFRIA